MQGQGQSAQSQGTGPAPLRPTPFPCPKELADSSIPMTGGLNPARQC